MLDRKDAKGGYWEVTATVSVQECACPSGVVPVMVIVYSPVGVVGLMVTVTVEVPTPCAGASWAGRTRSCMPFGLPLAVRLMLEENWPIGFTETSAFYVSP